MTTENTPLDSTTPTAESELKEALVTCEKPGQLLRDARLAKGITEVQAAKDLNFLPNYITALENEDFKPLHSATFIKGYLRAYARYLDIDADKVLYCFGQHYPELAVQEKTTPVEIMAPEKNAAGFFFKFISLLVLLALIALAILWWQTADDELPLNKTTGEVKVETLSGTVDANSVLVEEVLEESPATEQALSEEKLKESKPTQETQQPVTSTSLEVPVEQEAVANSAVFTGNLYTSTTNKNQLGLSFTEECWVEVRDAEQKTLHSNLMQAEEQLLLEGEAPFRVVFGNGKAAKLIYLGEDFDFSHRVRLNGYASVEVGTN